MQNKALYEYRTTFSVLPQDFPCHERISEDLSRLSPKPPRGEDWQLASSTSVVTNSGPVVLYFWERPLTEKVLAERAARAHAPRVGD